MGWQSAMVSSVAAGASTRASIWKRSCSSARSMARKRSGRSGWPAGVRWSRQAGWVISRVVDIGLSGNGAPKDGDTRVSQSGLSLYPIVDNVEGLVMNVSTTTGDMGIHDEAA